MRGLQFRVTHTESGKRSTTVHNKAIISAHAAALGTPESVATVQGIRTEKNWRFSYMPHLVKAAGLSAASSAPAAVAMASAGLDAAIDAFEFYAADGSVVSLAAAMGLADAGATGAAADAVADTESESPSIPTEFVSVVVRGTAALGDVTLRVPYLEGGGAALEGAALVAEVEKWASAGAMEPSCAASIARVAANSAWLDLRAQPAFVLLGATSEMGPLEFLLERGATVVAVARPGSAKWDKLIAAARASPGTLIVPIPAASAAMVAGSTAGGSDAAAADGGIEGAADDVVAAAAGCDLLTQTPAIARWLVGVRPAEAVTVCSHVYLDGEAFVRASIAMDVVVRVMELHRAVPPSLAYIDTPSHAHAVPPSVLATAQRHLDARPLWQRVCRLFGVLKDTRVAPCGALGGAAPGEPWHVVDMLSPVQGPNYAVAKLIQRWRAIVAMADPQRMVSINTGPPARTVSVMHSATMAAAINGFTWIPPNVAYEPTTVSPLMAALLLNDLNTPRPLAAHPLRTVYDGAWHGGSWCCPYDPHSSGKVAFLAGKLSGN